VGRSAFILPASLLLLLAACATTYQTPGFFGLTAISAQAAQDEERLKERQRKVQSDIKQAEKDLQESSRRVQRLSNRLETAESELRGARSYLSEVQGELAAARERATRIAGQLEQAEQRLETATNRVRKARRKVDQQRDDVRDTVITFATTGDPRIASLGALLNSRSLEEVMINQTANQLVVDVQFQSLHDLQDAEEALRKRRQQVREARNAVQEKKDEADAQVQRTEQLVGRASAARDEVDRLVNRTAKARREARQARAADREALAALEAREARIRRQILAARAAPTVHTGRASGYLHIPVNGRRTSPFGYRVHPIYGYYGLHDGVDFAAPCGTPLWAGADGRVVHAYYDQVYGYRIFLDVGRVNGDRLTLVYNHMPRLAARVGQTFTRGSVVGHVGTTGWSTGCHLHFTVLRNGQPVNPETYL
jgi:murein DD-endopeptidase MepM/ murein hydrolase activator NlpD